MQNFSSASVYLCDGICRAISFKGSNVDGLLNFSSNNLFQKFSLLRLDIELRSSSPVPLQVRLPGCCCCAAVVQCGRDSKF